MTPVHIAALGLAACCVVAFVAWLASVPLRDVSIVDSAWSILVMAPMLVAVALTAQDGPRTSWLPLLAGMWALRLAVYVTWRHRGHPEDPRYQAIRARNEPGFAVKSLYLVFGLQALLAWVVAMPVVAGVQSTTPWNWLDAVGIALFVGGLVIETAADAQLARFKANPANHKRVMAQGLWRFSRHPNYFGEFCVWWGLWLVAVAAGAWWTVASPLLMTVLLLKVSGVTLLEKHMADRGPAYRAYAARTNAFFPWRPHP